MSEEYLNKIKEFRRHHGLSRCPEEDKVEVERKNEMILNMERVKSEHEDIERLFREAKNMSDLMVLKGKIYGEMERSEKQLNLDRKRRMEEKRLVLKTFISEEKLNAIKDDNVALTFYMRKLYAKIGLGEIKDGHLLANVEEVERRFQLRSNQRKDQWALLKKWQDDFQGKIENFSKSNASQELEKLIHETQVQYNDFHLRRSFEEKNGNLRLRNFEKDSDQNIDNEFTLENIYQ